MDSIAKKVWDWIDLHPYIIFTLKQDLINFSSLARIIKEELEIKNFDAILVAIRRYQEKNSRTIANPMLEKKMLDVLHQSTLEIKTGTNVFIVKNTNFEKLNKLQKDFTDFQLINSPSATTIITTKNLDPEEFSQVISEMKNAVEIKIKSPEKLEATPGVIALIYSKLADRGINIVETFSCYTDSIIVVEKKDLTATVEVLDKLGIK
jgi:hypothetical protein